MTATQDPKNVDWLTRAVGGLGEPIRAIKLGPSIVAVLATLAVFGLIVVGAVTYFLSSHPFEALAGDFIVVVFVLLVVFLLSRFAERNPLIAALGGGQIYRLLENQMGAKNPELVIEGQPLSGRIPKPSLDDHSDV